MVSKRGLPAGGEGALFGEVYFGGVDGFFIRVHLCPSVVEEDFN